MGDYQKLVKRLRAQYTLDYKFVHADAADALEHAVNEIETLTRERDEARSLLREAGEAIERGIDFIERDGWDVNEERAILARIKETAE